jgi:hypothetical protein
LKFNLNLLLFPLVFIAFGGASYAVRRQRSANADQEILDRARAMLETAKAMRTYTTTQIARLLDREQSRLTQIDISVDRVLKVHIPEPMKKAVSCSRPCENNGRCKEEENKLTNERGRRDRSCRSDNSCRNPFHFTSRQEAFNYFRQQYPDYAYKEAALNPTNPRDQTSDWEMDVSDMFRNDLRKKEFAPPPRYAGRARTLNQRAD